MLYNIDMCNIVKLYNTKNYKQIQKYILDEPKMFNNKKYIYVRANTEYKLGLYENSYISFHTLLNKHPLNNEQRIINKKCSFNCLEKITENKKIKMNYKNEYITMPPNFGWIIPGILCAMSHPIKKIQIEALEFYNIKYIISLVNKNEKFEIYNDKQINHIYFEISELPSVEQTDKILSLIKTCKLTKEGILINCSDGLGKTGTILACYFLSGNKNYPQLSSTDAIKKVRTMRPNSIKNNLQEKFIQDYSNILWKRYLDDNEKN